MNGWLWLWLWCESWDVERDLPTLWLQSPDRTQTAQIEAFRPTREVIRRYCLNGMLVRNGSKGGGWRGPESFVRKIPYFGYELTGYTKWPEYDRFASPDAWLTRACSSLAALDLEVVESGETVSDNALVKSYG